MLTLTVGLTNCANGNAPYANSVCLALVPLELSDMEFAALSRRSQERAIRYECWYAKNCEGIRVDGCQ